MNRREFIKDIGTAGAALSLAGNLRAETGAAAPIPKRKLGRHDEQVSCIAIGGHTLAVASTVEEATRIAHEAIDNGMTFFDNAWEYHKGRAEEWMGKCLEGKRDKVFLETKDCSHGKDGSVSMQHLEESLRRLKTDHLDLWFIHQIQTEQEIERAFAPGGAVEAVVEARKQGKVRYIGFTGHGSADLHLKMLSHKFPFDAVLMPLSAFAPKSFDFEDRVLPELIKQNIAPLGMKCMGGHGVAIKDGLVTAEECVRYCLGLDITAQVIGINTIDQLRGHMNTARNTKPMTKEERVAIRARTAPKVDPKRHTYYSWSGHRDGYDDAHLA
jgi:predicted aldo/keto reductase-like oxidoreductase